MVETGAAVTVISEQFINDTLHAHFMLAKSEGIDCIRTANGNTVSVNGCVSFPVSLGASEYVCKALVVPGLAYGVILGRDFLYEFDAVIDVRAEGVTFRGAIKLMFASRDCPPFVSNIRTTETFVIDNNSETIIPASFAQFSPQPVVGFIDAVPSLMSCHRLLAASCLSKSSDEGLVTMRLLNPSDDPVVVHKGTAVGALVAYLTKWCSV